MGFVLAKKILKAHPHGFVGAIVEGRRSVGKSTYCIKVKKEVYQEMYGCDDEEAWKISLNNTLFTLDDIITTLRESRKKEDMLPVITWDDAGVHGSSVQWFINMKGVQELKAVTDTVRSAVTGMLLNCPNREGLTKTLRNYDDYLVMITKLNGQNFRSARGYNVYRLPSGMKRVYRNFDDRYTCRLPNWVYKIYMEKRNKYLDEALAAIDRTKKQINWKGTTEML